MNFDIAVNGRPWKVAVEPAPQPGQFVVVVKGRKRLVEASWIDTDTLSLIDAGAAREVRISRRAKGALGVTIGGRAFEAVVSKQGVRGQGVRPLFSWDSPALDEKKDLTPFNGPAPVKAPMPARVVRVLVAAGERVTIGQGLVVVEAMKMENELRSPKDGVVEELNVQTGAVVEAGAVLVVIGD